MEHPSRERFRVGRVVARSFSIWARELPLLLALALCVHAPRVACVEGVRLAIPEPPHIEIGTGGDLDTSLDEVRAWLWRVVPMWFGSWLLEAFFRDLSLAVVIFAVCARLRGERATFGRAAAGGLRRWLPVLKVSLVLAGLAFVLLCVPWLLVWTQMARIDLIIRVLGTVTTLSPVLIMLLLSPFWVAVPAAVVEEPRRLLRRSFGLTRGHRLAIGAIVVLVWAIDWGSGRLLWVALPADPHWLLLKAVGWSQDLVMVSLAAVFAAVGYHALRLEKEGVDVSDLEEVFA